MDTVNLVARVDIRLRKSGLYEDAVLSDEIAGAFSYYIRRVGLLENALNNIKQEINNTGM